ncbi:hypothetical protein XELAEV_18016049mg [Xenopus laevis]|uniref:Uncharacterized protein n=1 Tax=Xenopus laevis TaxID=8355 RepID=A0A974DJ78_XENLA|nr:hypothetical protein XELAEV_18016049mg [Xenopus laevis]
MRSCTGHMGYWNTRHLENCCAGTVKWSSFSKSILSKTADQISTQGGYNRLLAQLLHIVRFCSLASKGGQNLKGIL